LLLWIHHYRLSENDRETFKHCIIIEEAHHILLKRKSENSSGGEAITDVIIREIRELGEAIILIDQHPSLISIPALGNTFTTIVMNLKHRQDVNMAADCILLENDKKHYIGNLPIGYGIIKMQGRFTTPFYVKFPHIKIQKGIITDEHLKNRMQLYSYFSNPPPNLTDENKPVNIPVIPETDNQISAKIETITYKKSELTESELNFLISVNSKPFLTTVERYEYLEFSRRKGNAIKEALLEKNYIESEEIFSKNSRIILLKLTHKGIQLLQNKNINISHNSGNESVEHQYFKNIVKNYYLQFKCKIFEEYQVPDGSIIDLIVKKNSKNIAIEIETGKSDIVFNIDKNREKFDRIVIVPTNYKALAKVQKIVEQLNIKSPEIKVIPANKFEIK